MKFYLMSVSSSDYDGEITEEEEEKMSFFGLDCFPKTEGGKNNSFYRYFNNLAFFL